jgi:hypothetical protein
MLCGAKTDAAPLLPDLPRWTIGERSMSSHDVILYVVATIAFAFSCWLVFWTHSAVKFSQLLKNSPRSHLAFEPWYPLFLRFEGIWLWVMIGFILSARV